MIFPLTVFQFRLIAVGFSVKKYAEEYERLNVHFDVYTVESKVRKKWQDYSLRSLSTWISGSRTQCW